MNQAEFTVDDLSEVRQLWLGILTDMTRISSPEDPRGELEDDEIKALAQTLHEDVNFVSASGPVPKCISAFSVMIQRLDGNSSNIAECVPFSQNGEPVKFIAATAFDVAGQILSILSWEFFEAEPTQVRKAFSAININWHEILRLNARMERETSILLPPDADIDGKTTADESTWHITREDFRLLTMTDGRHPASHSSIEKLSGRIRNVYGRDALPPGSKRLPYLMAAYVWNRYSRTTVPEDLHEAKAKLKVAHEQKWGRQTKRSQP